MISAEHKEYIVDIHFASAEDFLKEISYKGALYNTINDDFIYRGHSTDSYLLLPSSLRKEPIEEYSDEAGNKNVFDGNIYDETGMIGLEFDELHEFFNLCDKNHLYVPNVERIRNAFSLPSGFVEHKDKWLPDDLIELAALAQHHGIKTRLLDWTTNINVAIYFAATGAIKTMLSESETDDFNMEIWGISKGLSIVDHLRFNSPLKIVRPNYHNNDFLSRQQGVFTYWEIETPEGIKSHYKLKDDVSIDRTPLDKLLTDFLHSKGDEPYKMLYHFTIPSTGAPELYRYAAHNYCDAAHLFPGYDGIVRCMKENQDCEIMENILWGE